MNLFRSKLAGFPYRASHSPGQTALSEWAAHSALKLGSTKRSALLPFSLHPNGAPSLHPSLSCERASPLLHGRFSISPLPPPSSLFHTFLPLPLIISQPNLAREKEEEKCVAGQSKLRRTVSDASGFISPPLFHAPYLPLAHGPVPLYIY